MLLGGRCVCERELWPEYNLLWPDARSADWAATISSSEKSDSDSDKGKSPLRFASSTDSS